MTIQATPHGEFNVVLDAPATANGTVAYAQGLSGDIGAQLAVTSTGTLPQAVGATVTLEVSQSSKTDPTLITGWYPLVTLTASGTATTTSSPNEAWQGRATWLWVRATFSGLTGTSVSARCHLVSKER